MHNTGVYVGAVLIVENLPTCYRKIRYRGCPGCGRKTHTNTEQFCFACGTSISWIEEIITDITSVNSIIGDDILIDIPVKAIYETGKHYLESNLYYDTTVNTEHNDSVDLTQITPELIETMISKFNIEHQEHIELLKREGVKCNVVFAAVPWWELSNNDSI